MLSREELIKQLHNQIDVWNNRIVEYQKKADRAKNDIKLDLNREIEKLIDRKDELEKKLGELKKSSGEAFDEIKIGADKAFQDLREAFTKASTKFN